VGGSLTVQEGKEPDLVADHARCAAAPKRRERAHYSGPVGANG
jgi:hypothetical protein